MTDKQVATHVKMRLRDVQPRITDGLRDGHLQEADFIKDSSTRRTVRRVQPACTVLSS